jgi:hypothetical protein
MTFRSDMRLNLTKTPTGGWQYYQPETGWSLPSPLNHSFSSAVSMIVKHRMANPVLAARSGPETVANDLVEFTAARLGLNAPKPAVVRSSSAVKQCGFCGR